MKPMKTTTRLLNALFLNLPVALLLCVTAQLLAVFGGEISSFSVTRLLLNFAVAYPVSCLIAMSVPCVKWGAAFACKCGAEPGTLSFGLLLNIPVNTVYSVLLSLIMTYFNACVLGGAPIAAVAYGFLGTILPVWLVCYAISFLCAGPAEKAARRCTNDFAETAALH